METRDVGSAVLGVNSCQQDLYLLARGGYPGVARNRRAEAARMIVEAHAPGGATGQASWKATAKMVLDSLLDASLTSGTVRAKDIFLIEIDSRASLGGPDMQARYYRRVIEKVLDRVAACTESDRPDGTCFLGFRAGGPDGKIAQRLAGHEHHDR